MHLEKICGSVFDLAAPHETIDERTRTTAAVVPDHRKCDARTQLLEPENDKCANIGGSFVLCVDNGVDEHHGLSMYFAIQFSCHL